MGVQGRYYRLKAGYNPAANEKSRPEYCGFQQTVQYKYVVVAVKSPLSNDSNELRNRKEKR
jgi:hypothetical protein